MPCYFEVRLQIYKVSRLELKSASRAPEQNGRPAGRRLVEFTGSRDHNVHRAFVITSAAKGLLPFDRLEQRLEVAFAEALRTLALDDLDEEIRDNL